MAEIGPGPAPVQYLLTANLTCDPTCVATPVSSRKLLGESSPWATLGVALFDTWQAGSKSREPRRRKLTDRPCCTTSTTQVVPLPQHAPTGPRPGPSYKFRPIQNPQLYNKRHPPSGTLGRGLSLYPAQDLPRLEEEYRERQYGEVGRKAEPKQEEAEGLQANGELIGSSSMDVPDLGGRGGTLGSGYFDAAGNWQTYDVASKVEEPSTSREMQGPKRSVVAAVLGNLRQSIFRPQEPTSQATQAEREREGSFDPLFPPQETQVTEFKSALPQYEGVMADYMARLEAAKRKAEALEMQRQQHMQEPDEIEASAASASIVAAAAQMEEAGSSSQAPPLSSQPKPGPQGILGHYMSTLEAARARQGWQAAAKGKQATAVIPDLDLGDINRTGSGPIDIVLKPQVSRGVNTQLAHLARVAAELKDLAGHVGQRAEGKLVARPDPRKSGIRSLQPSSNPFPRADVQPIREPLNVDDFSSAEALDLAKKTE
ncbi:hypothetical protein WJX82_005365 [Trebouxia sp. C0006]